MSELKVRREVRYSWERSTHRVKCPNPDCHRRHYVPKYEDEVIKCPCGVWFDPVELKHLRGHKWMSRIVHVPEGVRPILVHDCDGQANRKPHKKVALPIYFDNACTLCPKCNREQCHYMVFKQEWVVVKQSKNTRLSELKRVMEWDGYPAFRFRTGNIRSGSLW